MDSFHRRTDISSDKRHQRAVLPSQRYESISLPVRQRRVYGHPSTKRRNWIDDKIIDGCLYEELAESGAFSGRVNSTTMQFTNPFCFVVQVTAWIHFTAVPISPVISDTSGLSCHLNEYESISLARATATCLWSSLYQTKEWDRRQHHRRLPI
ncbi:hypothetical protein MRX96_011373 [Rhipicephalus microplus]